MQSFIPQAAAGYGVIFMTSKKMHTLESRLILLFSTIAIPLLLLLFLVGHFSKGVVLNQVAGAYQNLLNSNINMMDRSLDDITTNLVYIVDHDVNFRKFAQPGLTNEDYYFAQMELVQRNSVYQSYYHTVDLFFIFSRTNDTLVITGAAADDNDRVREWISYLFHDSNRLKSLMYKWSIIRIQDQYFLFRIVGDEISNDAYIGALINVNSLKRQLGNLNLGERGDILFASDDGSILSERPSKATLIDRLPAHQLSTSPSFSISKGKAKLFVVSSRSKSGIHLAVILPKSELLREFNGFQTVINLLPLLVLLILLLYLYIFRTIIFNPIRQLLRAIRCIKEGDMNTRLPQTNIMEFAIINHSFNSMVEEITDLKIGVYEAKLRGQKAEMKFLQMQINPHFFLNTLNIVFQLAELKHNELIKKTIRHLMQYFRFTLGLKKETITITKELKHLHNYLEIQKMRYQDSFEFHIRICDDLKDACIPSLIVQPLVENAVIHGMSTKNVPFVLDIAVNRIEDAEYGERLCIEVSDNGKGFHPEKLLTLTSKDYAPDQEEGQIGLWNVKNRLAMRYGEKAAIILGNNELAGAYVRIKLPIEYMEEGF